MMAVKFQLHGELASSTRRNVNFLREQAMVSELGMFVLLSTLPGHLANDNG